MNITEQNTTESQKSAQCARRSSERRQRRKSRRDDKWLFTPHCAEAGNDVFVHVRACSPLIGHLPPVNRPFPAERAHQCPWPSPSRGSATCTRACGDEPHGPVSQIVWQQRPPSLRAPRLGRPPAVCARPLLLFSSPAPLPSVSTDMNFFRSMVVRP